MGYDVRPNLTTKQLAALDRHPDALFVFLMLAAVAVVTLATTAANLV